MIKKVPASIVSWEGKPVVVFALISGLILLAVVRSAIATRSDGFTMDEGYHVTAGVAYFRNGDYRLNPEHPPLMKLWVGAALTGDIFELPAERSAIDKLDERDYTDEAVYLVNDPDRIQRRVRVAMMLLSALLLLAFALAARRVFGDVLALSALAFLAIDPTVAAHMPIAMTDLPVTLLSATAVLMTTAFSSRGG